MSAQAQPSVPRPSSIALVNNMPDAAFLDTEHQFLRAASAGGELTAEQVSLYTIPGLTRSDEVTAEIRARYLGLDELWGNPPECLIVTGTEPAQAMLPYEPYWPHLSQLLQWASSEVPTTLLSCLAAHASLLIFDGLERQPLPVKCSGVFEGVVGATDAPLARELPPTVWVPHSRVNDIPEAEMIEAGYEIVVGSGPSGAGWSVASRTQGAGTFVLCQGHPEYSTESLLREYRRDVRRFLFGRGAFAYPALPAGYLSTKAINTLEGFKADATAGDGDPLELYQRFPYDEVVESLVNRWADSSATLYGNWLRLADGRARVET